jgi:transcriptional regulator GlxA family with amidase domain
MRDGNCCTTSSVSAGIDGMLALIGEIFGEELAEKTADILSMHLIKTPSMKKDVRCIATAVHIASLSLYLSQGVEHLITQCQKQQ